MQIAQKYISVIETLPPLPTSIAKVIELSGRMNVSANELNMVISLDPVLTGKVLKLVNSAYFSLPNKVTSLVQAIVLLGINTVKNVAISSSVVDLYNNDAMFSALNSKSFWKHCLSVATVSKEIAIHLKVDKQGLEEYFITGLLHDIGKIILNITHRDDYHGVVYESQKSRRSLEIVERKVFGTDHQEIGHYLAQMWNFPKTICAAIAKHHDWENLQKDAEKFPLIANAANSLCKYLEIGFAGNLIYDYEQMSSAFSMLTLSLDEFINKQDLLFDKIREAEIFLKIGDSE